MIGHTVDNLNLHRPPSRRVSLTGVSLQHTELIKEQLLQELVTLESRMDAIKSAGRPLDFCALQTCREMIHSRRQLFRQLSR